ncbi:hypothetical protein BN11_2800003 [Nostocoides australiense Ben110]|uniref:Transposase IS30-like HTH domain-containing protein n=2 Tax=Nostocoides australiense Ben110 TaxID=1193182 RepID=W6JXM3_9MICO|nr:hypothetical protein BN11_2800003 [Tetrasphaera australiensis Ben110]
MQPSSRRRPHPGGRPHPTGRTSSPVCASTQETIRLHQQGMPWADIARTQGLHHTTISSRIGHWRAEQ